MIDSLRNTYLPYTTPGPPPPLHPTAALPFFHEYAEDVHTCASLSVYTRPCTRASVRVRKCTRVYTDTGTMYGFVARTSNRCAREHRAEGVNVYDKCEIPFRDDYVLLSFGWVTTDPLLPSVRAHTRTSPPPPFSSRLYRVV